MPLIYIYCPKHTFDSSAKKAMVEELTTIALQIEGLPNNNFVRSTAWTYIQEYDTENLFKGGKTDNANGISVEVTVFKGGLDFGRKGMLIEHFTRIINSKIGTVVPVYVLIREIESQDWGVLGSRITLDDLFHPPADAKPV